MTGLEYQNTVCPTTSVGKDPNREDVADAFEDGIAEGYKRGVNDAIEKACEWLIDNARYYMSTSAMCDVLRNVVRQDL